MIQMINGYPAIWSTAICAKWDAAKALTRQPELLTHDNIETCNYFTPEQDDEGFVVEGFTYSTIGRQVGQILL